jgi:RHS repeat-associated protein
LTIKIDAKDDLSGSPDQPIQLLSKDFIYQGEALLLIHDHGPPMVERILYEDNALHIDFNEEIDPASVTDSVEIEYGNITIGGSIEITGDNKVKFTPDENLSDNQEYEIRVKDIKDIAGKAVAIFTWDFELNQSKELLFVYSILAKNNHSIVGNNSLMHGRTYEPEVGLYYYRNRYYHPELGRFLQQDPMGYEDSMNLYQAFNQNPVNFTDPFGEFTYREFLDIKATDMILKGYSSDEILEFIAKGTFKRGYLAKVNRWNEAYIEYMFNPEEDIEYNAWGRKIALWFQYIASTAKSFWASQDSAISHTIGATLSDFGGGAGQIFNLGTKTGESIIQYERSKDFETLLIMGTTIWGEAGEAFLATYGGLKGYHRLKGKAPTPNPSTPEDMHHSDPKFMGGDPNQPLNNLARPKHQKLHKDLNDFLRNKTDRFGNHMRPQKGNPGAKIRTYFTRQERLNALAEFYKKNRKKYKSAARNFFRQHFELK